MQNEIEKKLSLLNLPSIKELGYKNYQLLEGGGWTTNELPLGCQQCRRGSKGVLFIGPACGVNCYYCTIDRNEIHVSKINERKIISLNDIINELHAISAEGMSLTGGDPIIYFEDTLKAIKLVKNNFSEKFHVHLYTSGTFFKDNMLAKLADTGLDEIRFHPPDTSWFSVIKEAKEFPWSVGAEIPAIPGNESFAIELASYLQDIEGDFLNLNELEFTNSNAIALLERGFISYEGNEAVIGSSDAALKILAEGSKVAPDVTLHFCTSVTKDSIQLRERYKRRGKNVAFPYETPTEDGLLSFGQIDIDQSDLSIDEWVAYLIDNFDIPKDMIGLNHVSRQIFLPDYMLVIIASDLKEDMGEAITMSLVEKYPIDEEIITRVDPLPDKELEKIFFGEEE
ncbi:MAG: radical SAM protein [Candidatus Kariarchaeaceae archaeon]